MSDVKIRIIGPGLVVNGPALIVLKALKDAGYKIDCEDWDGLKQWTGTDAQNLTFAASVASGMSINVSVEPYPWGG